MRLFLASKKTTAEGRRWCDLGRGYVQDGKPHSKAKRLSPAHFVAPAPRGRGPGALVVDDLVSPRPNVRGPCAASRSPAGPHLGRVRKKKKGGKKKKKKKKKIRPVTRRPPPEGHTTNEKTSYVIATSEGRCSTSGVCSSRPNQGDDEGDPPPPTDASSAGTSPVPVGGRTRPTRPFASALESATGRAMIGAPGERHERANAGGRQRLGPSRPRTLPTGSNTPDRASSAPRPVRPSRGTTPPSGPATRGRERRRRAAPWAAGNAGPAVEGTDPPRRRLGTTRAACPGPTRAGTTHARRRGAGPGGDVTRR